MYEKLCFAIYSIIISCNPITNHAYYDTIFPINLKIIDNIGQIMQIIVDG